MRIRPSVVIALGFGYVLGSRGGREHYDVIMRQLREVRERPEVQGAAGVVSAQAGTVFHRVRGLFAGEAESSGTRPFRPVAAHGSNGVSSIGAH